MKRKIRLNDKTQLQTEIDLRHYAPIQTALPNEASGYDWKRETGEIQSYQHHEKGGWLHIDPQGQFYDRHAQPIAKEEALGHLGQPHVAANDLAQTPSATKDGVGDSPGLSL